VSVPFSGPIGPKVATPWSPNQSEKVPLALGNVESVGTNVKVPACVPVSLKVIPSGSTVKWNTELKFSVTVPGGVLHSGGSFGNDMDWFFAVMVMVIAPPA
jgi:hypothetical protein